MRRTCVSLCLLAVTVGCGTAANSAAAEAPEFGHCIKQVAIEGTFHGKYLDSRCTQTVPPEEVAKKGKWEWAPGPGPNPGLTVTLGQVTLLTFSGLAVTCQGGIGAGELLAGTNKEASLAATFTGCSGNGIPCSTPGKASGEISTNQLVAEVGWLEKARRKTALELRPVDEGFFTQFKCLVIEAEARGEVLVSIKNDTITSTETLRLKESKGVQKPDVWHVGEAGETSVFLEAQFEGLGLQRVGLKSIATLVAEEPFELNPVA
ncbi:MAG TPA: hypothetical protein VMB05_18030 [Solirubrobacteraceae bacterium]|nr:hypothetical protein [Solirubrobacteraceae bacterium]